MQRPLVPVATSVGKLNLIPAWKVSDGTEDRKLKTWAAAHTEKGKQKEESCSSFKFTSFYVGYPFLDLAAEITEAMLQSYLVDGED